jgi:HPt (histidine-containing phosphotransfer) domain-containing protein
MDPSDLLDLTTLRNLVELDDGSYGLVTEMIAIFREDTPRRIQDILEAVAQGNAEELSRAGHALKGGSGALGAEAMRHLASDLEVLGRNGSSEAGPELALNLEAVFRDSLEALESFVREGEATRG